jgi:hypothetical protein
MTKFINRDAVVMGMVSIGEQLKGSDTATVIFKEEPKDVRLSVYRAPWREFNVDAVERLLANLSMSAGVDCVAVGIDVRVAGTGYLVQLSYRTVSDEEQIAELMPLFAQYYRDFKHTADAGHCVTYAIGVNRDVNSRAQVFSRTAQCATFGPELFKAVQDLITVFELETNHRATPIHFSVGAGVGFFALTVSFEAIPVDQ